MSNSDDAKGKLKEGVGKVTGDKDLEAEGKSDQVVGKIKDAIDSVKDKLTGN